MKRLTLSRAKAILTKFPRQRLLVVGDLMLDVYIWGKVSRISPEAPVPVVEVSDESAMPGGAGNVASNLCALGARTMVAGIVGRDAHGRLLERLLRDVGADTALVIRTGRAPTTVKTRVIGQHQHVVRIDREQPTCDAADVQRAVRGRLQRAPRFDAIIIEDYGKGVVTQDLVDALRDSVATERVIVAADPKKERRINYGGLTVVTPNFEEAAMLAGFWPPDRGRLDMIGQRLLDLWAGTAVLVTLGEKGMRLFRAGTPPVHVPTEPREVYDVAGAGDTVVAAVALAAASGASMVEAAQVANVAAGVVVQKIGTSVATRREILTALRAQR